MNMNETIQSELINAYDLLDNQAALERIRAIYDENREAINQSRDLLILYHLALPKLLLRNYQVPESTKSYEELFMLLRRINASPSEYRDSILKYIKTLGLSKLSPEEVIRKLDEQGLWEVMKDNLYAGYVIHRLWSQINVQELETDTRPLKNIAAYINEKFGFDLYEINFETMTKLKGKLVSILENDTAKEHCSPFSDDLVSRFSEDICDHIFLPTPSAALDNLDDFALIYGNALRSSQDLRLRYLAARFHVLLDLRRLDEALKCCEDFAQALDMSDHTSLYLVSIYYIDLQFERGIPFEDIINWLKINNMWDVFESDPSACLGMYYLIFNHAEMINSPDVARLHSGYRRKAKLPEVPISIESFDEIAKALYPDYPGPVQSRFKSEVYGE